MSTFSPRTDIPQNQVELAKSVRPNQIETLNGLMDTCAPDAATRSIATAAVILTMSQMAGPRTIAEPAGFLLVHAVENTADPIDHITRKCIVLHHMDPTGRPEQAKWARTQMQCLFRDLKIGEKHNFGASYAAQRIPLLMKANAQLRGGARSGCYSTRFDPAFGWCADESRHTILRLNEDNDRDAFCNHAINHDKNLCYPIGVDTNGSATTVKLSIAGSIKSSRVECNLVDAIVSQPLPVLFLPHLANQKLAGILELDLWLLASRIEALAGMHPISRSHSFLRLPEGEWLSYCYRKLRTRLSFFPPNYEFFINRTVRDLMGFCWGVSRLADVSETRSDLLTHLFIRLFKCCCHAVLLSVESLVWHGYGFHCQDHEALMKLLRVLRSQPQITKREILRKAQWLNSDNRDKLLDTLASEGLIEISERQVRAIPFNEFVAEIPKRSVPDPVFTSAPAKTSTQTHNEKPRSFF